MRRHGRCAAVGLMSMVLLWGSGGGGIADDSVTGEARVRDPVTVVLAGARFRLAGIAAPEKQRCGASPCADIAARWLEAKLAGRTVTCSKERRLGHGYFRARCRLDDGADLAALILAEGFAMPEPHAAPSYKDAYEAAKAQRRGIWSR